jgi:hypothetical protein
LREFIENGVAINVGPPRSGAAVHIVLGKPRMGREAEVIYLDFNRWTGRISFESIDSNADVIRARSVEYAECV